MMKEKTKKTVKIVCRPIPTKSTPIGYPVVKDEKQLDFKTIAELKAEVEEKNKKIQDKIPPAKILSFADLKKTFGNRMKAGFDMDKMGKHKKVRVFKKGMM